MIPVTILEKKFYLKRQNIDLNAESRCKGCYFHNNECQFTLDVMNTMSEYLHCVSYEHKFQTPDKLTVSSYSIFVPALSEDLKNL